MAQRDPRWEALSLWGADAELVEKFPTGIANDVWLVSIRGERAVARLGRRHDDDLGWETALLLHLDRCGLTVPTPIPTDDGRHFADGLVVMRHLDGGPPQTESDWRRVADTLRELHRLTADWPQRPGWHSSTEHLTIDRATKINLSVMPDEAVTRCRRAWERIAGRPMSVVHGDPNPGNILMTGSAVALIDWDEARVDVSDLDLSLPNNAAGYDQETQDIVSQASAAWEACVCFDPTGADAYGEKRLAEVRRP